MAETTTLDAQSFSAEGSAKKRVSLPGDLFDGTVNMPVMHQAVKAYLANQRQGNAATKTRGFVVGGNQKPWKQKGTGRARQGSTRAPHWVGGGTVFGPTPRSYREDIPKKVRALARKSALNARAREGSVIVIESFNYEKPRTRDMVSLLGSVGAADKKVLVLTDGAKENVYLSGRNLQNTHVMPYSDASTYHILWSDVVLIEGSALGELGAARGASKTKATSGQSTEAESAEPKAKPVKKTASKKTAKKAEKKAAKIAAPKKTAKKPAAKKAKPAKKTGTKKKGGGK